MVLRRIYRDNLNLWQIFTTYSRKLKCVVRVPISVGPARPSRFGRCTSYRLDGIGVGTGGRLLVFVALAQVKSLASCGLGLVGVASLPCIDRAPCALIGLWGGGACFCYLPPRVHRAPCVLIGWWGLVGCLVPAQSVCARSWWGGTSLGACVPDSSFFSAALVLHSVGASALLCLVCKRGGCFCTVIAHAVAGGSALTRLLILVAVPGVGWVPLPGSEGGRVQPRRWGRGVARTAPCASMLCARRRGVLLVRLALRASASVRVLFCQVCFICEPTYQSTALHSLP